METDRIIQALDTLSLAELRRVRARCAELIAQITAWQEPAEETAPRSYRQEYVRCGKPGCKTCAEGRGHGPYWYKYSWVGGKLKKRYVGKQRPKE